jgi:hypothetical protein
MIVLKHRLNITIILSIDAAGYRREKRHTVNVLGHQILYQLCHDEKFEYAIITKNS